MLSRIAVLDDYQGVALGYPAWHRLPGDIEVVACPAHLGAAELAKYLARVDAVVAMRERSRLDADLLAALPGLRLIVTTGMRTTAIDFQAAARHGIVVCGTRAPTAPTAELTWGLLLALTRGIPAEERALRAGSWQQGVGGDLVGGTLGIVGLGTIGRQIARYGQAFSMRVLAWSHNLDEASARAAGAELVDKAQLLARADVVTLHVRMGSRYKNLVGRAELALMKPGAILVNTSRGRLVDLDALSSALRAGHLRGAALDVFDEEPLPSGHPILSAPRTVLTPHIGYVTEATYERFFTDAVEDILAFLGGRPVRVITEAVP